MPFVKEINTPEGKIAIWNLNDSTKELGSYCSLSNSDQEKLNNITSERRKKEFLASRILVKKLTGSNQQIIYNKSGKPFLKDREKHISISHSANFAVVFISERKIGIDIEQTDRNIDRIAARFLHHKEKDFISMLENQQFAKILFWAAKEAIFKCADSVGIQFNKQIRIADFDIERSRKFNGTLMNSTKNIQYELHYLIIENNVMVYCVEQ
ncbi:4'-phosphopantetheinyl transferase superfamily protein [Prolixibacteraceae bacterium Z1-6]|uniref:4'-phosphopantetheinyl transferase superfamily protein n=1 Tax=Draconibacterium aestuarii TaxID=2998507 RepID=A0A9X3F8H8_9BACT|nr:4'-phosphopantetheinyl transferase superfamily protein [Prolixibacteraceae bacterium Z1-6]